MVQVDLLWITAALLSSPLLTLCDPLNVLSAPNMLRVGSRENVFVEAQDYAGSALNVRIVVRNHPQKNRELASESVVLSAANNYQALVAIKVKTNDPTISKNRQDAKQMTAQAYTTKGGSSNYLHIGIGAEELKVGDNMKMNLNFIRRSGVQNQDFTYLILSKGQIVSANRFKRQGQSLVTLPVFITKDLLPSFRVVAYYHMGSSEVVADSVWVDLKDTCMGTLQVKLKEPKASYDTGERFDLRITGDPGAKVGLVAVDKGVFVLNKNRLTQDKIWDLIEKHDTGCTAGSGKDSMGVFYDAGLLFESDKAGGTDSRTSEEENYDDNFDDITSRTQFPESWLWVDKVLPNCQGEYDVPLSFFVFVGICVADPLEIIVKKNFFVDLKLPYSAVRNEQLEIKAILHNFSNKNQKVRVEFTETKHICSAASKKGRYRTTVNVDAQSSRSILYIIIPMELGNHWIEVKAAVLGLGGSDGVRKALKVVSEGVLTTIEEKNVELNPSKFAGGYFGHFHYTGLYISFYIHATSEVSQTIEQAISGDFMGRLIVQPHGCGEQNMIHMTLPLIATHYLDTTKQWEGVGIHRRAEAIKHIQTGYKIQLTFRKEDGSYGTWIHTPSSTWLTAYVAKVFAMASGLIPIQENVLCSAIKWLVLKTQMPDGMFKESAPVYHGEMVGDVQGKDADASLTAFVLIAMQEGNELCAKSVPSLAQSMWKAIQYLERRIPSLTNPYAVAMTSYAMANAGKFDKALLMRYSSGGGAYWEVTRGHHFSLEATAYALLALVKVKEFDTAGKAVNWLNRQTSPYGSSGTTQATIMVFQSVAEYYKQVRSAKNVELNVEVAVSGQRKPKIWVFRKDMAMLTRSDKVKNLKQEFTVTAKGNGVGSLKVITIYYARPTEKESDCKDFDLTVKMEKQRHSKIHFDPLYKSRTRDATMSILDIGLLTGFVVDETDLTDLTTGRDKYIQKFEMDKQLSERGSLILYLDKVSHEMVDRIAFRVHKITEVAMLQPAGITVYEYYSPDKRCTKFYHPTKKDGALSRLCNDQQNLCRCAEENCSIQKKQKIGEKDRKKKACEPGLDYVYRVKVVKTDLTPYTDYYTMKIEQVLKEGTDTGVEGQERSFMGHANCRESFGIEKDKTYLIMGRSVDLPKIDGRLQYILGEQTWIEYWPTREEGQTQTYREKYVGVTGLAQYLTTFGCTT
uniref:NTR domain-containing protein n=1 Tax=Pygocentrus nattereri TaxID=42514 RepID=A0AAR2J943_PYGNA